ncbi:hypothetical protein IFM89_017113 [Coptis chinensis]|uniref:Nrap protein domain-containing protein n=1 Tax=Coptis chinensis TaxID=261450 RepID=A0A835LN59_9MAGN|nr:hypothetical protein IFM89_017113 [Coptis chinensis]
MIQKTWGMTCIASEDDVDVLMSGYAFRLEILHERGLNMVKKQSDLLRRQGAIHPQIDSSMINGGGFSFSEGLQNGGSLHICSPHTLI